MITGENIRLTGEQPIPDEIPLRFTAEVIQSEIDEDKQPIIEICVENPSQTIAEYFTGWVRVFGACESEEKNPGLVMFPEKWTVELQQPLRPTEGALILDTPLCRNTFRSGDTLCGRRRLWDHPKNTGEVFSTGSYSFCDQYLDDNYEEAFTWGFSIKVI
jgi:hypothetical protein